MISESQPEMPALQHDMDVVFVNKAKNPRERSSRYDMDVAAALTSLQLNVLQK